MNPYAILAFIVFTIANGFYWHANGSNAADTRWKAKTEQQRADAESAARSKEKMWQGVVNETAKNYDVKVAGIQRNLDIALDGLRDRPERPVDLPATARANCKDANGAELAGKHAAVLERYAAAAATQDAALAACYTYADKVR